LTTDKQTGRADYMWHSNYKYYVGIYEPAWKVLRRLLNAPVRKRGFKY
jgi:hypothetical protein